MYSRSLSFVIEEILRVERKMKMWKKERKKKKGKEILFLYERRRLCCFPPVCSVIIRCVYCHIKKRFVFLVAYLFIFFLYWLVCWLADSMTDLLFGYFVGWLDYIWEGNSFSVLYRLHLKGLDLGPLLGVNFHRLLILAKFWNKSVWMSRLFLYIDGSLRMVRACLKQATDYREKKVGALNQHHCTRSNRKCSAA